MADLISILIPTKGRIDDLQQLLRSLSEMNERDSIPHEIMIINNAADQNTAETVAELVQSYISLEGDQWKLVRENLLGPGLAITHLS